MNETPGLQTLLPPDAQVPETRMQNAREAQDKVRRLIDADLKRAKKRSLVQGLIDGNPPYRQSKLNQLGRKDALNVNFGTAASYIEQCTGIFQDLFAEAPTNFVIHTGFGDNLEQREEWSRQMTEIADDVLNEDPRWQFLFQNSQRYMVMHGCGPLLFETPTAVLPRWVPTGDLKVDELAESETSYWEFACILCRYKPHELFDFIRNPEAAQKVGWRVKYTRWAIMNAVPLRQTSGITRDWEFYQTELKTNAMNSFDDANVIKVAHCFWREFGPSGKPGKITHAIVEQETNRAGPLPELGLNEAQRAESTQYLYFSKERYDDWSEVIHPMYYDRGNGYHYTVTGMGVPLYGAMQFENKLRCNLGDKAMSPKLLFKPTSEAHPEFTLQQLGDWGYIPASWEMLQTGAAGLMQDGMVMLNEVGRTVSNNLAQYRQSWSKGQGNPPTLGQVQLEAQMQYRVANTQVSRYYKQLDVLYREIVKRLCDKGNTDPLAVDFRKRCEEAAIPKEALGKVVKVEANRVAGQGSAVLRQGALDKLMMMAGGFPENGQENIKRDWIAAYAGQRAVDRYYPKQDQNRMASNDEVIASLQVAAMKEGMPPKISSDQDPLVFARVFLTAAMQALGAVPQGADPATVVAFVDQLGAAAAAHIQRLAQDPMRKGIAKQMTDMLKQIGQAADKLKGHLAQQPAKPTNGQPQLSPEDQEKLLAKRTERQMKITDWMQSRQQRMRQRDEEHKFKMSQKMQDAKVDVAKADLETAANIRRGNLKSLSE